jgi:hypothetical protein
MMYKAAGCCLLALALAACGPGNDDVLNQETIDASESAPIAPEPEAETEPAPAPPPAIPPSEAEMGNEAGDNLAEPIVSGPRSTIPAAFHGRWGEGDDDCSGIGPRWVEISPKLLSFPDMSGQLLRVEGDFPQRFIAIFGYQTEDQRWRERDQLVLTGSSNSLVLASRDGRFTYQRCR